MSSTIDAARQALGQQFMIGFSGLELADETATFLSQAKIGGVILFGHNFESPAQLAELSNQIQECRIGQPLWIAADHEGGKVQRFKKGFTRIPEAALIGKANSPKLTYELGEMMAAELRAVGVNINFCPVADIATNPKNPVIGSRAFGDHEDIVTKISTAIVRGHLVQGVQPCVKHFPGHGDTSTDSHFALPRVDTPLEVLREREFKPFVRAFKSHCSMVMTAHILNSQLDPKLPATLSSRVLRDLLRKEMRYTKLIISDDMEMKAITDHFGAEDAPRMAIEAGCDMLIYRSEAGARHAYASVLKALEDGKLDPVWVLEADARIQEIKKELMISYLPVTVADVAQKVGIPAHQAIVDKLIAAAG
jgi:beta-N-acetylhexosaminidase